MPLPEPETLSTEALSINPAELTLLERNAHFMPEKTFKQLCDNIRRDGCLTSAPLVAERAGKLLVLSGNHRVKAALAVGLHSIPIIRVIGEVTEQRQVAIQLAHNALVGDDDPNLLRELYESLDILEQRYTGLTDSDLGVLEDPDLVGLSVGLPAYEELTVAFLPEDLTELAANVDRLKLKMAEQPVFLAKLDDYLPFFNAMLGVKVAEKVGNDGVALLVMSQLALRYIEERDGPIALEEDAAEAKRAKPAAKR